MKPPSASTLRPLIQSVAAFRVVRAEELAYFDRCEAAVRHIPLPPRDASDDALAEYAAACIAARGAVGVSLATLSAMHADTTRRAKGIAEMARRIFGGMMFAGLADRDVVDCVQQAADRSLAPAANATS